MNKTTFLKELRKELRCLKPSELQKNISYYDEFLSDMMEQQLSEEEAVARLGAPHAIAAEILENTSPHNFRRKDIPGTILVILSAVLLLICLFFLWKTTPFCETSVSIIGGADGPTSIFIAGKVSQPVLLYAVTGIVIIITAVYKLWRRR
ncbi:MAG: DUF1700 domain-containing protein [Clostridiales bacterium]|nr:DUF1700 domain-containing protein [Clostridiales bacterium]